MTATRTRATHPPPAPIGGTVTFSLQNMVMLIALVTPLLAGSAAYTSLTGKVAALEARVDRLERQGAEMEAQLDNRVERIDRNVAWLCQERRRDNLDTGKVAAGDCATH